MRTGDLVRVVRLPRFWGSDDIRGEIGIVVGYATEESNRFLRVMIGDRTWTVPANCAEVLGEAPH